MAHNEILKTINYNLKMLVEGTGGAGGRQQREPFFPKKDRTKEARSNSREVLSMNRQRGRDSRGRRHVSATV